MALVGPWVHCNAFNAQVYAQPCMVYHIGIVALSRISDQGNFIQVDTQSCHGSYRLLKGYRLLNSCSGSRLRKGRPRFWIGQTSAEDTDRLHGYIAIGAHCLSVHHGDRINNTRP